MATKTKKPLKERSGVFKVKVKDYKAALNEAVNVGYHLGWEAHSICRMCAARAWLRVTDSSRGCGSISAWTSITPAQRVRQIGKCSAHKVADRSRQHFLLMGIPFFFRGRTRITPS